VTELDIDCQGPGIVPADLLFGPLEGRGLSHASVGGDAQAADRPVQEEGSAGDRLPGVRCGIVLAPVVRLFDVRAEQHRPQVLTRLFHVSVQEDHSLRRYKRRFVRHVQAP
jgi:hypothetical protein